MKQVSREDVVIEARLHATGNRKEIEVSKFAECFSCVKQFDVRAIQDWKDEWISPATQNRVSRWSALCPHCGEATVIGSASGLLSSQAYIPIVHDYLSGMDL